jgi:hypothetical protein
MSDITFAKLIYNRLIDSGLATPEFIQGCSVSEINQIEQIARRKLPADYLQFMFVCGKNAGRFLRDVEIFYPEVIGHRALAEEILTWDEDNLLKLPSSAFVFATRQGEAFMFFEEVSEDPQVKIYLSGKGNEFCNVSNSFRDLILTEIDSAAAIYQRIRGTPRAIAC